MCEVNYFTHLTHAKTVIIVFHQNNVTIDSEAQVSMTLDLSQRAGR